jgi:hypothetical protein
LEGNLRTELAKVVRIVAAAIDPSSLTLDLAESLQSSSPKSPSSPNDSSENELKY